VSSYAGHFVYTVEPKRYSNLKTVRSHKRLNLCLNQVIAGELSASGLFVCSSFTRSRGCFEIDDHRFLFRVPSIFIFGKLTGVQPRIMYGKLSSRCTVQRICHLETLGNCKQYIEGTKSFSRSIVSRRMIFFLVHRFGGCKKASAKAKDRPWGSFASRLQRCARSDI